MKCIFSLMILFSASQVISQEYYFRQMPLDFDNNVQKIGILFQGSNQMLWVGTDNGLYSFDGSVNRHIKRPDGVPHVVTTIAEGIRGEIWTGYDDGFIYVINFPENNRVIPTDSLKGVSISKILFQDEGNIFITTYGRGIWCLRNNQLSRLSSDSSLQMEDIYDAILDPDGRLWLATDRGIWIYQKGLKEEFRHLGSGQGLPDEIVTKLLGENNGDVWIGLFDHGLARYLVGRDSIINVMTIQEVDGSVVSLVKGQKNTIWFGTEKTIGSYTYDGTGQSIQIPVEIKNRLDCILLDNTDNLWIASGNKLYMANTELDHRQPDVTGIQTITALDGKLWLGCESGLYSMDEQGGGLSQHLQHEQLNILSIYADPSGFLWIGTFGQGLYIYDPYGHRTKHLTEKDNISNNSILNIDGTGSKLWLATLGGITEIGWSSDPFRDKLTIIDFQEKFQFPASYVFDVYAGKDGKVWFGTDGKGLYYLEQDELHPFNHPIALPGQDSFDMKTIYSITTDNKNNLWVSTTMGNILNVDLNGNLLQHISSAHGSENSLITSGEGEIVMVGESTVQIKNPSYGLFFLSSSIGITSFSPNLNAVSRDKNGSVWIADTDNILHYVPSGADTARYVHMHLVDISPGHFDPNESIRLRPDSNFLDMRFTGLWYQDPLRVQYRYKLKGHDQDWIYTREGRAVYSKISPGKYTFIVAGSYNEDFSKSKPLQWEVIVLPPYYLTWWFISGSILFISFLTYMFIRLRIRHINKLHQLEKEKTTLKLHAIQAQVNPHFLFNSFNTLSNIIEEDQKGAVAYVDQLSDFFRGVLMHRNDELIPLAEEMIIMRNYAYILQKRYGENIRIIEQMDSQEGYIAPLSIQLLVENAIKHNKVTNEKPLTIKISIVGQWVVVSNPIERKFQVVTESTGFGLSSLLTRYQYLTSSKVEILNDGNTFTVKIPIIYLNT